MLREDFAIYNIQYFTPSEIENTGAELKNIDTELIVKLDHLRNKINKPFILIKNGLTTGKHTSKEHYNGKAVDFLPKYIKSPAKAKTFVYKSLETGFRGIGLYYNNSYKNYHFHLDLGKIRFWKATKNKTGEPWDYNTLFNL